MSLFVDFVNRNPNFNKVYEDAEEHAEQHIIASVSADAERKMRTRPSHGIRVKASADLRYRVDKPATTFLSCRVRPSTLRAMAVRSTKPCLSTAYIGLLFKTAGVEYANAVAAFLNSTLGWLQVLNQRAFTLTYTRITPQGAGLLRVPPPDSKHIPALAAAYRKLANAEMSSLRNPDCPVRVELDRAAAKAVGWRVGRVHDLRRRIAAEPSVSGVAPEGV